jgi:Ca2+-binding RTX toxin-like protein
LGADTMAGGDGDDTDVIDNSGDVVRENPGGGNDRVRSSISCTLLPFLEHLSLLGSGPLTASGNTLANVITGNAGADTFIFQRLEDSGSLQATADLISDFSSSQGDRINLSGLDANPSTLADNAFTYIGTAAFTAAGQARRSIDNGITYVELNTNADLTTVEMTIALTGALNLTASNFVL